MVTLTALLCVALAGRPATQSIKQVEAGMARLDGHFDVDKHSYAVEYEKTGRYHAFNGSAKVRTVVSRVVHTRKGQKIALYYRSSDDAEGTSKSDEAWFTWDGNLCARKYGTTLDYYSYLNPVILNYFEYFRAI